MIATSKELFLAILAMDSYNRGYGAGIGKKLVGLGEDEQIGFAETITRKELNISDGQYKAWQKVGFYAVAYEVKAGAWEGLKKDTTVISYRGTHDFAPQYV